MNPPLQTPPTAGLSLSEKLNGPWHERALWGFTALVLAHWAEHFSQAFEIYVLGWKIPDARGLLGLPFPWLIRTETLHYVIALIMLIAFWVLRKAFVGRSHVWWMTAFWIQFWHHIEHALLQYQAITGQYFFHAQEPTSLVQLIIPRVELHLFYNTIVTIPMAIAMFYHMFPSEAERARMVCPCAWHGEHGFAASGAEARSG